jgi:prepilin-type N-terminal cleavage/methylation domain-containing protein
MNLRLPPRGFTLTEILAAVAILSVLFTIMFGILQQTSVGWQAANRKVEAAQVARLALEQIAAELQGCTAVAEVRSTPRGSVGYAYGFVHTNITTVTNPPWISGTPGMALAAGNDYLYFVAPQPSSLNAPHGDLCEFGYIPVWNPTANTNTFRRGRYFLLRHFPFNWSNTSPIADFARIINWDKWETTPSGTSQTNRLPFVDNCLRFDVRFVYWIPTQTNISPEGVTNVTVRWATNDSWGRPAVKFVVTTNVVGGITNLVTNTVITWDGNPSGILGLPFAADLTLSVLDERSAERLYRLRPEGLGSDLVKVPDNLDAISGPNAAAVQATLREGLTSFRRRVEFQYAPRP